MHLNLDKEPVRMELGAGATVSVMSEQQWESMFDKTKTLEPYKGRPLQGYSGQELQVVGQARMNVQYAQRNNYPCSLWLEIRGLLFLAVTGFKVSSSASGKRDKLSALACFLVPVNSML